MFLLDLRDLTKLKLRLTRDDAGQEIQESQEKVSKKNIRSGKSGKTPAKSAKNVDPNLLKAVLLL